MSLDFDDQTTIVSVGSPAALDNAFDNGGTLSFWMRPNSFGENNFGRIYDKNNNTGVGWSTLLDGSAVPASNTLRFQQFFTVADGDWNTGDDSITLGVWTHAAITYNNGAASNDPSMYLNAVSQTVVEIDTPSGTRVSDSGQALNIGNRPATDRTFDGPMADMRIYDRILSASEIQNVYTANGHDGIVDGLILRYAFFGQTGVNPTVAFDLSPSGENGTISGVFQTYVADELSLGRQVG